MKGLAYWRGMECEGSYSDIQTLFVRSEIPKNYKDYPHIYFTFEYVEGCISNKYSWDTIADIMNTTKITISLEANDKTLRKIPKRIYNHAHVLYRIQIPTCDIDYLKRYDTITLDNSEYNTYTASKYILQHVDADEYKHDIL